MRLSMSEDFVSRSLLGSSSGLNPNNGSSFLSLGLGLAAGLFLSCLKYITKNLHFGQLLTNDCELFVYVKIPFVFLVNLDFLWDWPQLIIQVSLNF